MAASLYTKDTLLNAFLDIARSADVDRKAVECGDEHWTYGDLDNVSTGIALEIHQKYGLKPIVAVISENHPYILAILLATWKLGGIFAPLDHNVPRDILERMLSNIGPTFVLAPASSRNVLTIAKDMSFSCIPFEPKDTTITALMQKYLDQSPELSEQDFPAPSAEDIALYLHTSSASSVANVKCVPLTHQSTLSGSRSRLSYWKRTWPNQEFVNLRVLGWSPWSHVIGLSSDVGASMLLTAGCYVFAIVPSAYGGTGADSSKASRYLDVCGQLLETAMIKKPTAFAGVPWVLEGLMRTHKEEKEASRKQRILDAIKLFKVFGSGGAATNAECVEWAAQLKLPLVFDLGMTELGGPLFHSTVDDSEGWHIKDCLLFDASLHLVDESGATTSSEGELVVRSRIISKGYLRYDNSAFTVEDNGTVSFHTGDIYGYIADQRLIWKGRKEDYVQMSSGESLDPREVEAILDRCPAVARSCVVGNNFLKTSSQVVCAIIQPDTSKSLDSNLSEITRSIATANRSLAPPLRISWSRVLILKDGQEIPITRKGAVFRKKLEELFGEQLSTLLNRSDQGIAQQTEIKHSPPPQHVQSRTKTQVASIVSNVVLQTLRISEETMDDNSQATFAELGMDSAMSTMIVNKLNRELDMNLPMNTCHTYVDLVSLTNAILSDLGMDAASTKVQPTVRAVPQSREKEEIVIVGQAIRLPGDINSPDDFWKALIDKREDIMTPVPASRWDHASFYRAPDSKEPPSPCDITLEKAGFIDSDSFDHSFFGISSAEAFFVAPNIRLSLEIAFEALENANIPPSKVKGSNMGVFVAACMDEGYIKLLLADKGWGAYTRYYGTGVATSTACGRLSYLLDVHGPSLTIDTACSSGLIAFDQAVQYLQSGEGESAIVCGANTHAWPGTLGFLSAQKMTSANSRCATFTNMADGYVPTEAAAGLILKTKSAALRDGDHIIGVVRSTDVKHDGRSQGLVAPNVKAQIAMQIALLEKATLSPSQIDFIEAHGTGTSLGDLIEIQGINEVFESSHATNKPLVVGAAKSCVGHAELIAGLIGVCKTLGSFAQGAVPGLVQLKEDNMNPNLDCSVVPLHIPIEPVALKTENSLPLRGLILSNGFAGSIAGAILEAPSESMNIRPSSSIPENTPMMFVVSGKSQDALTQYLSNYLDFCLDAPPSMFHAICYTTCVGREHYRYRFACVVNNMQDLIARIEDRLQDSSSSPAGGNAKRILLGFPGQGSQYQGMGRNLANQYSGFRSIITDAANKASGLTGYPILPYLLEESAPGKLTIDHSEVAQVCIFIFQYSVSTWLEGLGIHAHAVMGHSLGEIAAAVIARAFTFEVGLQFVVVRAKLLRADPSRPAGMAAIAASAERVNRYILNLGLKDRVAIAVFNGPEAHVVSGELKAVEMLMTAAKKDGLRGTKLNVDQGFHSPAIVSALPDLRAWLDEHKDSIKELEKPFFSTLKGAEIPKHKYLDAQYWIDHAQNSVRFVQTAIAATKAASVDVIVDVGPQPTIWSNMQTPEYAAKPRLAFTGKRGKDQIVAMLAALSSLFEKGFTIQFDSLFAQMPYKFTMTDVPTYPFQRLYNYPAYIATRDSTFPVLKQVENQVREKSVTPHFVVDQALCDFLELHKIEGRRVLPGAAMVEFFARASSSKTVKVIKFHTPLILETPETQVRVEIDEQGAYKLVQQGPESTPICSGIIADKKASSLSKKVAKEPEMVPLQMMSKAQIYEYFKNVQFGEQFRTVQEVRIWEDHADADIRVEPTVQPAHDRIRKVDACLHMFGAVAGRLAPPADDNAGAYLPASLEDFTLHTDDMPNNFICRYYLPLDIGRGARTLSLSFEVFSESGVLLLSCRKYSVAWVPRGVVHKEQKRDDSNTPNHWLRNAWMVQNLPAIEDTSVHQFDELLYLGSGQNSQVLNILSSQAKDVISVDLSHLPHDDLPKSNKIKSLASDQMEKLPSTLRGTDMLVVLDFTKSRISPGSDEFISLYLQILMFMKLLMSQKLRITNMLALTSWSAPVDLYKEGLDLFSDCKASSATLIGSIIQGMIRVFRRETGLDFAVWGLDIPDIDKFDGSKLQRILKEEIQARHKAAFSDTFVGYRENASNKSLVRLVPSLEPIEQVPSMSPSGTVVIVGMGSIGIALASSLIESGCTTIAFLGRRPDTDGQVRKEFDALPEKTRSRIIYRQVDVCDRDALKTVLADINYCHNGIKHIIHTAAVVKDATITASKPSDFQAVLRPKVIGSWNLHVTSKELNLALDSFVLLSSTNVIVGNPGQIAYVSANSFMDSLATFRHNSGMPGTSLQLGAWESKLIGNIDMSTSFALLMKNEEGLPLILKAMSVPIPLQIIAHMDSGKLAATPAYAKDPFFGPLIPRSKQAASGGKSKKSTEQVKKILMDTLRVALELQPNEKLELGEPLTSLGADSITFAQFKGQVLKDFEVDVPMIYLSDGYTINDMIDNILEQAGSTGSTGSNGGSKKPTDQVRKTLMDFLHVALELQPNEKLELGEPLTSLGADSITFAQFKGQVLKEFEVDVPMIYLSDAYTINDMINHIVEACHSA